MTLINSVLSAFLDFLHSTLVDSLDSFWVVICFMFVLYRCVVIPFWSFLHISN